jgi:exo-beta-1,3-glucanase (GH17 family)
VSFSFSFVAQTKDSFDSDFESAFEAYKAGQASANQPLSDEAVEQIEAAADAAQMLVEVNGWPSEATHYNVTLSGHANPGHAPAQGYANDYVQVSVTQTP